MEKLNLVGHFNKVERTREHNAYTHSVGRTLTIIILGFLCKLQDIDEIQQWAEEPRTREFLSRNFAIYTIPTCRWINEILSIVKPESLNEVFTQWTAEMLPTFLDGLTISFDGKTICSTGKMSNYDKPLHILSAYLCESGLTIGQKTVDEKSNEIPAMRELIKLMDIRGSMVVADALHCQTETAAVIIENVGDYLLNVKGNQEILEDDIRDFVEDEALRSKMETEQTRENNGGRIEIRTAFVSDELTWMKEHLPKWLGLACFGAINRCFTYNGKTSNEWHYYISSRKLTAEELLKFARNEWAIESMHWLLDVHFNEDSCRTRDKNSNQNLNIFRKIALNYIRQYKNHTKLKTPMSKLMFACLLDCNKILDIINFQ